MMQQTTSDAKPVYAAAGMLVLAAALTLTVVVGLSQSQPYTAQSTKPPSAAPSEVRATAEVQAPVQQPQQPAVKPATPLPAPSPAAQSKSAVIKAEPKELGKALRPLTGEIAVQYGWQLHPVFKDWRVHYGIDIMGAEGDTVAAVWPGEVKDVFQDKTAGLTVAVTSGEYTVYYGALSTADVRKGASLKAGTKIGTVGSSQAEPYPHLHLAIKKGDKHIDPVEKL